MHDISRPARGPCRIGPLTLDPEAEVLLLDGVPLPLGRRAVSILLRLAQAPGEIVGKEALYASVWGGQAVEDSNLTVQMSQLRRTLAEQAEGGGKWIETVARRGYRFIGPTTWHRDAVVAQPVAAASISNVPIAVPLHFTGRGEALDALHAALTNTAMQPLIVALHGLRGIGKTILAAAYAKQHQHGYRAVWWLRAETKPTLRADLAALAVRLGWVRLGATEDAALAAALDGLRNDGKAILLVYDNAFDASSLRPFLPVGGGARIIVTSNAPAWRSYAVPVELELWPAAVGADYLIARTGRVSERGDAERLSAALGGLPLAHEQAAAYIESLECSIAEYLRRFDAAPARLLDDPDHAPADYHDGLTVAKAFHLTIEQAAALHPAAVSLLHFAALLAPEPIPVLLFRNGREAFGECLAAQLADDGLDRALVALRSLALISREEIPDEHDTSLRTDCLRVHRLIRQVATSRAAQDSLAGDRASLIAALVAIYPENTNTALASWPLARRLDALALPLVAPPANIPQGAEQSASVLLDRLATFHQYALAAFGQAEPMRERALALAEANFGPFHPFTAQTMNNLALMFRDHGNLAAAGPLHARALAIREAVFGPHHHDVAVSLNNLANVLAEQGDPAAARPLFERALVIWEMVYGKTHFMTARGMNNLARQLHRLGENVEAAELHQRALRMRETVLGRDHPDTANSLKNLALLNFDLNRIDEAHAMCTRALHINEAALGPDHHDTATIRAILAQFMLAQNEPAVALPVAERALAALAATLARDAPATRAAAGVTADCLDALGKPNDAADIRRHYLATTTGT